MVGPFRHADPRATEHYDRPRGNLDRHGVNSITAYVAGSEGASLPSQSTPSVGTAQRDAAGEPASVGRRVQSAVATERFRAGC